MARKASHPDKLVLSSMIVLQVAHVLVATDRQGAPLRITILYVLSAQLRPASY